MATKKRNYLLICFLIFIVLLSLALGGYFLYNKFFNQDTIKNDENNVNNPEINEQEELQKINSDEDWIYDADYNDDNDDENLEFTDGFKIPYINIDSEDAKKGNDEIKQLYDEAISNSKEVYAEMNELLGPIYMDYDKYIDFDFVSLALKYSYGDGSPANYSTYTYNFDLTTGKKLSFEELALEYGLTDTILEEKISEAIKKSIQEKLSSFEDYDFPSGKDMESVVADNLKDYKELLKNNNLRYYVNSSGNLNIILYIEIPGIEQQATELRID